MGKSKRKRRKSVASVLRLRKGRKKISSFWLEAGRLLGFLNGFFSLLFFFSPVFSVPLLFIALMTIVVYVFILIDYVY
ncbi:MAG: hypothetical protein ACTSXX_06120 [Candidatus Baldrarchaeia archaeon]